MPPLVCRVDTNPVRQRGGATASPVDERTLADLMGEIQDPKLRLTLLRLCVELAEADAHVDGGESTALVAAVEHWGLHREMVRPSSRN